jgi:glycine/D-amino acid oxidase-like deaminating enzyme
MAEWRAVQDSDECWQVEPAMQTDGFSGGYRWMSREDAHLAAAAPDLKRAASAAIMEWERHGTIAQSCRDLERAIIKSVLGPTPWLDSSDD